MGKTTKVIAICNQKGGVGKTTTAAALSILISRAGMPVHMIDMDPQASLTGAFGHQDEEGLLFKAMARRGALPKIQIAERLSLTPGSIDMSRGENQFIMEAAREQMLRTSIEKTDLDPSTLVIIDSPPSLGVLAINCLCAARGIVIVVQPGGFELRALAHLEETIGVLKERVNPDLKVIGVIMTNCHVRRAITDQIREELAKHYPVFGMVRSDAQMLYATTEGTLLNLSRSNALEDYGTACFKLLEGTPWLLKKSADLVTS